MCILISSVLLVEFYAPESALLSACPRPHLHPYTLICTISCRHPYAAWSAIPMSRVCILTSCLHFMDPVSNPMSVVGIPCHLVCISMSPVRSPTWLLPLSTLAPYFRASVTLLSVFLFSLPLSPRAPNPAFRVLAMLTAILSPRVALGRRRPAPF